MGATFAEPVTSLRVEIRTSSARYAGTDDDVYLRVGAGLRFALDKRLYDDFERGDRDTYSVPIDDAVRAGLTRRRPRPRPDREVARRRRRRLEAARREADRQRPPGLRARRDRALARGRPPHLAGAGLPARAPERARRSACRSTCGTTTR